LDISINGFWGSHYEKMLLRHKIFNPLALLKVNPVFNPSSKSMKPLRRGLMGHASIK